ncbi:glycosyltransferase family 2 protein [Paenibacillus anaericanus]|uniref:glycosyltransferase family 2 protein n=1 Tax=Paenibacillus anaericanus TaxID=170367 RepID=UPI0027D92BB3|nr:glycosyltransferase family A protein [Paenibacillus anaericanus]
MRRIRKITVKSSRTGRKARWRPNNRRKVKKGKNRLLRSAVRRSAPIDKLWWMEQRAIKAGFIAASDKERSHLSLENMQESLNTWYGEHNSGDASVSRVLSLSLAYRRGYALASRISDIGIALPLQGKASVVVSICNEEQTLPAVLSELCKLPLKEIIVVLNGCTDGSFAAIVRDPRMILLHIPERLGHDVSRALGSALSSGDIVLFCDGDMSLPAEELAAFLIAVDLGVDIALNNLTPYLPTFSGQDDVTRCKTFLNQALGRSDLGANSLTAVPHALSRKAIETLGTEALIVPPKAQALALVRGLKVSAPYSVNVVRNNRIRSGNTGEGNSVAGLIIGDHVEAFAEVMKSEGNRLRFVTYSRSELAKVRNAR